MRSSLLSNALEADDVFVGGSTEFHRFEDDLISDARWQDKDAVSREIGAPILLAPIQDTLMTFRENWKPSSRPSISASPTGSTRTSKFAVLLRSVAGR